MGCGLSYLKGELEKVFKKILSLLVIFPISKGERKWVENQNFFKLVFSLERFLFVPSKKKRKIGLDEILIAEYVILSSLETSGKIRNLNGKKFKPSV